MARSACPPSCSFSSWQRVREPFRRRIRGRPWAIPQVSPSSTIRQSRCLLPGRCLCGQVLEIGAVNGAEPAYLYSDVLSATRLSEWQSRRDRGNVFGDPLVRFAGASPGRESGGDVGRASSISQAGLVRLPGDTIMVEDRPRSSTSSSGPTWHSSANGLDRSRFVALGPWSGMPGLIACRSSHDRVPVTECRCPSVQAASARSQG